MKKKVLLGICGGIAAYKSCELVRLLKKAGYQVNVVMTQAATDFISPTTFQALSGEPVLLDTHDGSGGHGMAHINLSRQADVMLIAPASANTLAKIAQGMADNLLTTLVAARNCPLAVAPAMNVQMWNNPANQRNLALLQQDQIRILGPAVGEQACGEVGRGRMLEAADLADLLVDIWTPPVLTGKRVLITAGATFEAIDPVRGITNISSGQMGMALARACRAAGANVSLVYGQMQTALVAGLAYTEQAISADAMLAAVQRLLPGQDVFISVAAVADYKVRNRSEQKLKKQAGQSVPVIELTENADILATVAARADAPFCVGFAAESEHVLEHARAKRLKKGVPLLVANEVSQAMGKASNQVVLLDDEQETALPQMSKDDTATAIVVRLAQLLARL
ncbi:phosphopantothenate synthase [Snodgrassella communis]|jgi:phosphopantothenoylcysteine decarboxylase / phosphopantothenate---cysteine ligase|uniref:bifunctional phosphopantothenoylcysteine decarboxylase/phosphopantothenate--cysteine ligase CoaBC n=1 Tax=Snodgrassella communis TaxID=2946699 RepID=UPI000C1E9586|nr:bifunctional phosphopantothenoylcysteine decarboxylase/phosphopantothenate--cysteine ligase CoaBC [Snodgrassella communis]PIT19569.1 phosphopantothenate synthase [Snodgrassella communis]PIT23030.1 phosphopantothenate synthase [Snodgrassella communis]